MYFSNRKEVAIVLYVTSMKYFIHKDFNKQPLYLKDCRDIVLLMHLQPYIAQKTLFVR